MDLDRIAAIRNALFDTGELRLVAGRMVAKPGAAHAMAEAYNFLAELAPAPKVKPVEGDEVWVQMPGSDLRCRGNLVAVRHEWAWVEVRVGATTFVTALYGELERA